MAKQKIVAPVVPDPSTLNPQNSDEFLARGWVYYSLKKYEEALSDMRKSIETGVNKADAYYALGLCLKATGASQQALEAFGKVDQEIAGIEDKQRATIISRLAHGQVNQIKTGDWNLEKEVWKRVS